MPLSRSVSYTHLDVYKRQDADRAAFELWLAESPSHGVAWQRLNAALDGTLHALRPGLLADGDALRRSLVRPQLAQRRRLGKLALAGGALLLGAGVADRYVPLQYLAAGYVTRTGERRRVALPDGNVMELDARSAASWEGQHVVRAVSYTHLDVYKRQGKGRAGAQASPGARRHRRGAQTGGLHESITPLRVGLGWTVRTASAHMTNNFADPLKFLSCPLDGPLKTGPGRASPCRPTTCLLYTSRCV